MSARYLLRLDDACPTMRTSIWSPLESMLDELGVRPIVGVIPSNRDPTLACSPPDPQFWSLVRAWKAKGWSVALHGHHHAYHPIPARARALLPVSDKSEFVGRTLAEQTVSLQDAYATMTMEGVAPRLFMAPSHSFDTTTLQALRAATDIRVITDGHALGAYEQHEFVWIPQQLWRFRAMPFGLWCVCLHPNSMNEASLGRLADDLKRFARQITDVDSVLRTVGRKTPLDAAFGAIFPVMLRWRRRVRRA